MLSSAVCTVAKFATILRLNLQLLLWVSEATGRCCISPDFTLIVALNSSMLQHWHQLVKQIPCSLAAEVQL
jgi:hypothetical protein